MMGPLAFLGAIALIGCLVLGVIWFAENVTIKKRKR